MKNSTNYIETYTIKKAIIQHEIIASQYPESSAGQELLKEANWLRELSLLKDETPLTETWLNAKFQYICGQWVVYSPSNDGDVTIFHRGRTYTITFNYANAAEITTIGQLRMFITILGFGDFAQKLKS